MSSLDFTNPVCDKASFILETAWKNNVVESLQCRLFLLSLNEFMI